MMQIKYRFQIFHIFYNLLYNEVVHKHNQMTYILEKDQSNELKFKLTIANTQNIIVKLSNIKTL